MEKNPIAVLYADGHMQEGAWAHRPIKGDAAYSLKQIVSKAISLGVDVLGAGDLIDKAKVMSWPVTQFFAQLDHLQKVGLKFYYVRGQHEGESDFLSAHPAAVHLDCGECSGLPTGHTVLGIDYQPVGLLQERLNDELSTQEAPDILLLHQVWGNLMGDIACPQGVWEQIPKAEFVLTGDYHEDYVDETVVCEDGHELRVINPGSVCMQSISEPEDKFFCVLYDDMSVEKIQLKTRRVWRAPLISSNIDMDEFVENAPAELKRLAAESEELPEGIRTPLVRVEYGADVDNAKRRIARVVGSQAHLFYKQRPIPKPEAIERQARRKKSGDRHATTLETKLPEYLEGEGKKHLLPQCQRVLQVKDPFAELVKMKNEYINQE